MRKAIAAMFLNALVMGGFPSGVWAECCIRHPKEGVLCGPQYCRPRSINQQGMLAVLGEAQALMSMAAPMPLEMPSHQDEQLHPPHKMIMYGETEVYVSHKVYTKPHNYQIIIRLHLNPLLMDRYLGERRQHPGEQFYYVLDPMDISQIRSSKKLTGTIFRIAGDEQKTVFPLQLAQGEFEILYFSELPYLDGQS